MKTSISQYPSHRAPVAIRRRRAQVLAEFGLTLPVLLLMFAAIVDIGMYLQHYVAVQAAVREGGRIASVPGATDDQIRSAVVGSREPAGLSAGDVSITRQPADERFAELETAAGQRISLKTHCPDYQSIEVRVDTRHSVLMPLFFRGPAWTHIVAVVKTLRPGR